MAVSRFVVPLLVGLLMPLAASARETYNFTPELPTARGVDRAKLQAILPKLQMAAGVAGTISPAGGTLKLNGLTLEFPKGAVAKPTQVQWTALSHPDIVFGWILEPRDTRIVKPLTLHSPKADLVFKVNQLGAYVLMADRQAEAFHFVALKMKPAAAKPTTAKPTGKASAKPPAKAPVKPKPGTHAARPSASGSGPRR